MSSYLPQFEAVAHDLALAPIHPSMNVQLSVCGDARLARTDEDGRSGLRFGYYYVPTANLVLYQSGTIPRAVVDRYSNLLRDTFTRPRVRVVLTEIVAEECQSEFADGPCALRHEYSESWPFGWPFPALVAFSSGELELHIVIDHPGGVRAQFVAGNGSLPLTRWQDFPVSYDEGAFDENVFRKTIRNIAHWISTRWTEISATAEAELARNLLDENSAIASSKTRERIDSTRLGLRFPTKEDVVMVGPRFTMCQWADTRGAIHWAIYDGAQTHFAMPHDSSVALASWRRYLERLGDDTSACAPTAEEAIVAGAEGLLSLLTPPMHPLWAEGSETGGTRATFSDGHTILTIFRVGFSELKAEVTRRDVSGNAIAPAMLVRLPELAARPSGLSTAEAAEAFARRLVDNWSTVMQILHERLPT